MSGPFHPTGRGKVSASNPSALAVCDKCGFTVNHKDLRFQYQWNGMLLQNLQILVCDRCYDTPQIQLKTIIIPPDPLPIYNPRPEFYAVEVPSFITTESMQAITTEDGDNLITEIEDTPSPDPNNPVLWPPN